MPARNEVAHESTTKLFEVGYGLELESAKPNVLDMASMVGKALYLMASCLLSKSISKRYPSRWLGGSPDLVYLLMIGKQNLACNLASTISGMNGDSTLCIMLLQGR